VWAVAFSREGNTFITGGCDSKAYLWSARTARKIGTLDGHKGGVCAVALSPDGKLALTGGADEKARLWNVPARTCQTILEPSGAVLAVAFSPDGQTFLTGGEKGKKKGGVQPKGEVRLYEIRAGQVGKPVFLRKEPNKELASIITSAAGQAGGLHPLWQAGWVAETLLKAEEFPKRIQSAAFSPKGETLLIGDDDWETTCWDVASRKQFAVLDRHGGEVRGVAFAPDGDTALTGAHLSGLAHLWDVRRLRAQWGKLRREGFLVEGMGPRPRNPPLPHPGPITAVAFGCDGQHFLTACEDGYVRVWRKAPGQALTGLAHSPKPSKPKDRKYVVTAVAFHPSGEKVATVGRNGKAQLWSVTTGGRDGKPLKHPPELTTVAFPDRQTMLTGGVDRQVGFWDLKTRTETRPRLHHPGEVVWLSLSHDGSLILTSCTDGKARLWDVKKRQEIGAPLRHNDSRALTGTAISPDNQWLLTGSSDGTARLWDKNGKLIHELKKHQNRVSEVNFSPDGTRAATSSYDRTVRVWDAATGNLQRTLRHRKDVFSVAFTSDSKRVLTGSRAGAQMWDVQSGRRVGPICRYKDDVRHVAFSPDGKIAVLADWSGYGVLWTLPQPFQDDPERLTWRVQTAVGMKLDEGGGREVLDGPTWLELQERLRQPGGPP
jgi:WD40 repeat protein